MNQLMGFISAKYSYTTLNFVDDIDSWVLTVVVKDYD